MGPIHGFLDGDDDYIRTVKQTTPVVKTAPLPGSQPETTVSKIGIIYEEIDPRLAAYSMEPKTEASAGFDMRACIPEALIIKAGDVVMVPTGVRIQCPFDDIVGLLFPRSGLGHKDGIILGNGTGVIDADFTGEIGMSIWNRSDKDFEVQPMDRLAQLVFVPRLRVTMIKGQVKEDFRRGSAGFGSSGVR